MYPTLQHDLAKARVADLHRQAERDRIARTARRARKAHDSHVVPSDLATSFARRVLAALAARSLRPPSQHPGQAPKATS
jgi:hypothetical protein